jgi:hypothetical protein
MKTNYHNTRNSKGQFSRRPAVTRTADGQFTSPFNVVAGRLYNFRGATVRALQKDTKTGNRLVSFHKALFGFVNDRELERVDRRKVKNYLAAA